MGTDCSSELKEKAPPAPLAQCSVVPSPVVSSFTSHRPRRRRDAEASLTTCSSDAGSCETGCSGKGSFSGYVPLRKITQWLNSLPPPSTFSPVPNPDVWSDGEREAREWLRTEGEILDDGQQERWDAPHYVSALGLHSPHEPTSDDFARRRKAKSKARCL